MLSRSFARYKNRQEVVGVLLKEGNRLRWNHQHKASEASRLEKDDLNDEREKIQSGDS